MKLNLETLAKITAVIVGASLVFLLIAGAVGLGAAALRFGGLL